MKGMLNRSPLYYGFLYLILIPVYAFAYTVFSGDFAHSNIQREQVYLQSLDKLVKSILSQHAENIDEVFREKVSDTYGQIIGENFWRHEASDDQFAINTSVDINESRYVVEIYTYQSRIIPSGPVINNISIEGPLGVVRVSRREMQDADAYTHYMGLRRGTDLGNFSFWDTLIRMVYFSVVTNTTLGYGDIVPISNRARIIVGSQSIIGLVLMGLFLNAVANSRKDG